MSLGYPFKGSYYCHYNHEGLIMSSRRTPNRPKILCIDDDSAITLALRLRLERYDVDVLTAIDGTDGFWMAINEHPDVIVTDIRMENGGGDYLVECLQGRTDTCDVPIIALTGTRDCELKRWMLTLGVKHYFQKPLRFEEIADAIGLYVCLEPASEVIA
jgi:DNA-binding response OmpR family regulator